ncbi:MAG: hypothetical protein K2X03_20970 [Bryobacteraceae bacterium]|nr:hypothetical protein [Bryobacteraceae bacterium]
MSGLPCHVKGHELLPQCRTSADGYLCQRCGGALAAQSPEDALRSQRGAAIACYVLGPLSAYWYLNFSLHGESREVRFHAWQSIWLSCMAGAAHLLWLGLAFIVGQYLQAKNLSDWNLHPYVFLLTFGGEILLLILIEIALLIVWLQLTMGASEGRMRCLPIFGRWAARRAGVTLAATDN